MVATVIGHAEPDMVVLDVGSEALSAAYGPPIPWMHDCKVEHMSGRYTHCRLGRGARLRLGDQLWLLPAQCDMAINRFAALHMVRDGHVVNLVSVDAGGCSQ